MNFNAETPTEIITPYKVVLIAIISNFCHISDGRCDKVFDISDFGGKTNKGILPIVDKQPKNGLASRCGSGKEEKVLHVVAELDLSTGRVLEGAGLICVQFIIADK